MKRSGFFAVFVPSREGADHGREQAEGVHIVASATAVSVGRRCRSEMASHGFGCRRRLGTYVGIYTRLFGLTALGAVGAVGSRRVAAVLAEN